MRKQWGMSLVELMVSMTVGLVLLAGVTQLFLSSNLTFSTQTAMSRVQETGRLAIEFLSEDIRMAGYMGCINLNTENKAGGSIENHLRDSNSMNFRFGNAVEGMDSSRNVDGFPVSRLAKTDAILVRSASGNGVGVARMNDPTQVFVEDVEFVKKGCASGGDKYNGFCVGDIITLSSCGSLVIFQATGFIRDSSSGTVAIQHSGPYNAPAVWGDPATEGDQYKGDDAQVITMESTFYYIANGTSGRPSLFRNINGAPPQELLEGVEDMQITYGLDTNGDDVIDAYEPANEIAALADWEKVSSVRFDLLVASIENNVLQAAQPYTFNNKLENKPGDRRLRQVFTSVVTIRSRVP